jgi:heat-inducible transcriptional repressor
MRRPTEFTFDDRSREILTSAIRLYVETGEPVGSRTLSRLSRERLSAATIRNLMADLEEAGYLAQPHTSAGRVPTDKGYRFYVDNLIGQYRLSKHDEVRIHRGMFDEEVLLRTERLMERTSRLLSQVSNNIGIVVTPSPAMETMQQIDFIRLVDGRILVVIIGETGVVQDRVIRFDSDFSQEDLDRTARFLTENYRGQTLSAIRDNLIARMSEEKTLYDTLLKTALLVCDRSIAATGTEGGVYLEGATKIIDMPDFADTERMRELFRMFEEKSRLVKILSECLAEQPWGSVRIQIGAENRSPGLRNCALVVSPLHVGERVVGGLGVVGPTRMEYARVISIVGYVAKLFERVLLDGANAPSR